MILVLSLHVAGRLYRIGERGCSIGDELIRGGLATGDYTESIELFGDGSPDTYQTDLVLPLDYDDLLNQGHQPWGEEAELALVDPAATWASRRVLRTGTLRAVSHGAPGGVVRVELVSDPAEDLSSYPPAEAVICAETMGSLTYDSGADGIDMKFCHGYLGSQILRPYNTRKWKYGGAWENRRQFAFDLYERIRKPRASEIQAGSSANNWLRNWPGRPGVWGNWWRPSSTTTTGRRPRPTPPTCDAAILPACLN
jgi:hypothetical protein